VDNPFQESATAQPTDESLVKQAQEGSRQALEQLVKRHQGWIYNIAVRMVWYAHDAEAELSQFSAWSSGEMQVVF
jgi:hypothetical protein